MIIMKKLALSWIIILAVVGLNAQKADSNKVSPKGKTLMTVTQDGDNVNVKVFDDTLVNVDEQDDTVRIKLGGKGINVVETDKGTHVEITDMDDEGDHIWKRRKDRFRGHWAGYELGINNFADINGHMAGSLPAAGFLDLNTGKSWNSNVNFMQYSLPMGSRVGWVTGMGVAWNNYTFDKNNVIGKDAVTDRIIPVYPPAGSINTKAKMNTTYLTVPLLFEMQFTEKKKAFISLGVIGELKLHSNTIQKYHNGSDRERIKTKDDFNLTPLRASGTVRVGYRFIRIFANVGLVPLFRENLGPVNAPDLYPFTVGLILTNFR